MSYAPTLTGWTGGLFYYDAKSLARYTTAYLVWKALQENKTPLLFEAVYRLREDKTLGPNGAISLLLNIKHEYTKTNPVTTTVTYTLTTTKENKTITKTISTLVPLTVTEKTTITKTRTITFNTTHVYTVTAGYPSILFSPETLFILGITAVIVVAAVIIIYGAKK